MNLFSCMFPKRKIEEINIVLHFNSQKHFFSFVDFVSFVYVFIGYFKVKFPII